MTNNTDVVLFVMTVTACLLKNEPVTLCVLHMVKPSAVKPERKQV